MKVKVKLLSCVRLFATPWAVAHQAPLSMGILQARILECIVMPSFRGSSQPRVKPRPPTLQADALPSDPAGKHKNTGVGSGETICSPGDLPNPRIESGSPALQADSLLSEPPGNQRMCFSARLSPAPHPPPPTRRKSPLQSWIFQGTSQ